MSAMIERTSMDTAAEALAVCEDEERGLRARFEAGDTTVTPATLRTARQAVEDAGTVLSRARAMAARRELDEAVASLPMRAQHLARVPELDAANERDMMRLRSLADSINARVRTRNAIVRGERESVERLRHVLPASNEGPVDYGVHYGGGVRILEASACIQAEVGLVGGPVAYVAPPRVAPEPPPYIKSCPTAPGAGLHQIEDEVDRRWHTKTGRKVCIVCGQTFAPDALVPGVA